MASSNLLIKKEAIAGASFFLLNFQNTHSIEYIYVNASGFHSSRQEVPSPSLREKVLMTFITTFGYKLLPIQESVSCLVIQTFYGH